MGWPWTSPSSPGPSAPAPDQPPPSSSSTSPLTQSAAPNEPVDAEIQKFYNLFKSEPDPPTNPSALKPTAASSSSSAASPSALSTWLSSSFKTSTAEELPVPPLDPVSESLLPTDMSCRQAFDLAWSCNSLGGQWNAVYRQGTMSSCGHLWDDFWFCMRTKSFSGPMKKKAVREHYRRKEYEKYHVPGKNSSEDIWEARTEKVEPGTAFAEAIELPAVNDDEWRRMEDERRRKIRKDIGI